MSAKLQLGFFSRSRVHPVRQTEVAECGLACLAMIAGYYGLAVDLGTLRRRYPPSPRGASLTSLIATADLMGFSSRAVKLPLAEIPNLPVPAILHWDMSHFVVLEQVKRGRAHIHNPSGLSKWYTLDELSDHFTGVALELDVADGFEPADKRERLRLSQLWRRITGLGRALLQTLVLSLVLQVFVLVSPYYVQVALDQALPALDYNLLTVLALGFGLFTLLNTGATILRSFVLLTAGTSLSYGIATNLTRRLFRLPIFWFERRQVGDILSRFQSIAPIQRALTQGAVATLIDGALAILTLMLMFFYSVSLSLIALVAFGLYLLVRLVSFSFERVAQEDAIASRGKEQSPLIESVRGITTLRLFNAETIRHSLWQSRLTDAVNAEVKVSRIGIWQQTANTLIFGLENIVTVWIAVGFLMSGGFSVGMFFAFLVYKSQFLTRAASLADQAIEFRMLGLHLERLSDIAMSEQDIAFKDQHSPQEFCGCLELLDISFRYGPSEPLVFKGISLRIEQGEHIAITGPSGGGKSTLVKILLGLTEPTSGGILIDGVPIGQFGHRNYRGQIAAVMQDDHLFAGSLADNIALFHDAPDMERIIAAAIAASIHDDIIRMPMRYETLVGDMGSTLSGGQKQRVILARALYRRPKLLILDEGTSHLDHALEQRVNAAIAGLGITRIVIAHRAETIQSAGKIFVMERGELFPSTAGSPRSDSDMGHVPPSRRPRAPRPPRTRSSPATGST